MKTRLVYTHYISGHNIEYVHHLYEGAQKDLSNHYVFAVPEEFEIQKQQMEWKQSNNVAFHYIGNAASVDGNILSRAWKNCRRLKKAVRSCHADEVILITLIDFVPFLQLMMPEKVKVKGILYRIYLYYLPEMDFIHRMIEKVKMYVITHSKCIESVLILNDKKGAQRLNSLWKTEKYSYLPDPCVLLEKSSIRNMREELNIAMDKTIVLHIGSINYDKGFDRIFKMIDNTKESELANFCFIFAGKVSEGCKELFYAMLGKSKTKANILVMDEFLPYDVMGSLVYTADKVVLPYRRFGQSSGIIAYCAQMKTPVYVPDKGLIYHLVKQYGIGTGVSDFTDIHSLDCSCITNSSYVDSHRIEDFYNTILDIR